MEESILCIDYISYFLKVCLTYVDFKNLFYSIFITKVSKTFELIPALLDSPDDAVISDELSHASIIDAIRLSKAKRFIYKHLDMNDLEEKLKEASGCRRKVVVTDGVFSMDGDIAPLPKIVELCQKYEAILVVDDAHGEGVLGNKGRGIVDHFNLHGKVDIEVGTLSKAFGVVGGFVSSNSININFSISIYCY